MTDFFSPFTNAAGFQSARLPVRFDAERDTPALVDGLGSRCPQIRDILASLREALPLVPHCGAGPIGRFFRIPNHYRSVAFLVPSVASTGRPKADDEEAVSGAIVFKGTEPLLNDFEPYLDWMLRVPFRSASLPLALHLALDMKLPPAAMWIEECIQEQRSTSCVQAAYLERHGRLAKLPVPLFVYELTSQQVQHYKSVVQKRLSAAALTRIETKLADGLGVEVYYYPTLPVRVADLTFRDIKEAFLPALNVTQLDAVFLGWIELLSELLQLNYMPFAEWNHGMGACVDPGNACIDGGFNDLLTLVPFEAIHSEDHFRRGLSTTIQLLASSIGGMCAAAAGVPPASSIDSTSQTFAFIWERLRAAVLAQTGEANLDERLRRCFVAPTVDDLVQHLRQLHRRGQDHRQFVSPLAVNEVPRLEQPDTLARSTECFASN
jgi:hypothetical protein